MIKHKPKNTTGIKIDGKIYRCNKITGILELPIRLEHLNPIDKPKKVKKVSEVEL